MNLSVLSVHTQVLLGENMAAHLQNLLFAVVVGGWVALAPPANAQAAGDMVRSVSGGLMSPHVELRLSLSDGTFHLVEPAPDAIFEPLVTHDGRISKESLAELRAMARKLIITGFKTPKCKTIDRIERQRSIRLAQRGIIRLGHHSMDSQFNFWVYFEGKSTSAPEDESCWRADGSAFYSVTFQAVHRVVTER